MPAARAKNEFADVHAKTPARTERHLSPEDRDRESDGK